MESRAPKKIPYKFKIANSEVISNLSLKWVGVVSWKRNVAIISL